MQLRRILLFLSLAFCYAALSATNNAAGVRALDFLQQDSLKADSLHPDTLKADSLQLDSLKADSLQLDAQRLDSLRRDSIRQKSSIDMPVFSTARDSIVEVLEEGKQMIYYYGDVSVKYDDMDMKAEYMAYNVDTRTVFAKGLPDPADSTGKTIIGSPVMTKAGVTYEMESVYYNFKSGKAKISNMITQEGEGFMHGNHIKRMPDNSFNVADGKYTTCDYEHPHFYLKYTNARMVNTPNGKKNIVFGPAYVVVEDVPTPFAIPFGFVPNMSGGRSSGILMPSWGEETARGFFMRDLGYYFVFGEHWDLAATGDIYTRGSWAVRLNSRYTKRYKYSGNVAMNYSVDITGERNSPDYMKSTNFSVQWSHAMDAKAHPGTKFTASVNFSSPKNSTYNSTTIESALQNQISSSISFGKTWAGTPFSITVNALHSQNSRDSSYAVTLPNITFTVNRIYPFKRKERVGKERFYEQFSFNYSTTFDNKINFKSSEFNQPGMWKKLKNGMKHSFTIGLPGFSLLKYIQVSPGISYGMNWYFSDSKRVFNQQLQKVETVQSNPFSTFGISQNFSASISFSTRIYGMFDFGKKRAVEAIRHMITPSISFSWQPNMRTAANGFTSMSYIDVNGIQHNVDYNIYEGQVYSPVGSYQSASMSFSIGNNIEAKVRDRADTTGKGVKKIKIIDQLSIGGSYNFMADSMKLSMIQVNMSTSIFGKLALNANASLDPYAIDEKGNRYNKFNISKMGGLNLFRLMNASFSTSYTFQGKGEFKLGSDYKPDPSQGDPQNNAQRDDTPGHRQAPSYQRYYYDPITGEYIPGGWVYYTDPKVPWSVNMNFNYSYSRSYQYTNEKLVTRHNHLMTLGVSSQVRFTDALSVNLNSGFDLTKLKLSTTQLSGSYDLHCFGISISWIPNGTWESWSFRIAANASALADLLQYKKNASYWDR
ncbi:MAG: putative LPS assembly protein LptD [Candidatus Egerieousia sp.]|nr:putative LPS assembly protein LptD [bacterium]MDY5254836.1 putative LPS assembly protein LptD [Candidatus Egerieousia sp.]